MDSKQGYDSGDQKNHDQKTQDEYICPRCEQVIPSDERAEHDDWHFAKDLEDDEQNGVVASQGPPQSTKSPAIKQAGDKKMDQPPTYAPPSYAPPVNPQALVNRHTNKVTEAARVRAMDEVSFSPM